MIVYLAYPESVKPAFMVIIYHLFMHQQGSPYRSHDLVVGGNNDFGIKLFLECPHYTLVKSNPP